MDGEEEERGTPQILITLLTKPIFIKIEMREDARGREREKEIGQVRNENCIIKISQ